MVTGIDVVAHAGQVVIVDNNGQPLVAMSADAAEMMCMRMADCVRECRGLDKAAFLALSEVLTRVLVKG